MPASPTDPTHNPPTPSTNAPPTPNSTNPAHTPTSTNPAHTASSTNPAHTASSTNPAHTASWSVGRNSGDQLVAHRRPLPDAVAIDLIPVPISAPPYDDDLPHADPGEFAIAMTAPREERDGSPRASGDSPAHPGVHGQGHPSDLPRLGIQAPDQPVPLRDPPGHWPNQFAQVLAETLAGSRPPSQIAPWTTDQARRRIRRLGSVLSTTHRPRVKRVIVTSPAGGVLELAIVVGLGTRVRALAVRLERTQHADDRSCQDTPPKASNRANPANNWVCTAIEAA
jgi:hypothetical protein